MSMNGVKLVGKAASVIAVVNVLWTGAVFGQQHTSSERLADISGCYAIVVDANGASKWTQRFEEKIWLTTVELRPNRPDAQHSSLLIRPAPGEKASSYPLSYWTLLPDGNVQLVWSSGMEIVRIVFKPHDAEGTTSSGTATHFSDALDTAPSEFPLKIQRVDCYADM